MTAPEDLVDSVYDEHTFVQFLAALSDDWYKHEEIEKRSPSPPYDAGALGWENGSIGAFLEAASAYGESCLTQGKANKSDNPWHRAAEIILAGKLYE
ncbi:DUF7660 family protein [Hyphococcus sp.]|jgi:hypothetical protein|uniref:DUF7660 family protein n=1 Tax=Hyphococcus sp. TaxID=2038636 RepID=UPI003D1496EA